MAAGPKTKRREREGSKVKVLGFKNGYRLERVSRIKDWKKNKYLKNRINK